MAKKLVLLVKLSKFVFLHFDTDPRFIGKEEDEKRNQSKTKSRKNRYNLP